MPRRSTETSAPKTAGAHYTPNQLAEDFAAEALRVWAEPWCGMEGHEVWERETRIVDPACGDGTLILAAAAAMWLRLRDTPKHKALKTPDLAIVERALSVMTGVELREDAAAAARAATHGCAPIVCADGLKADGTGALMLMNPPWVGRSRRTPAQTAALREVTGQAQSDFAVAFLRAFPTARQVSAILPKACIEGDSRVAGLQWMIAHGWSIRSATTPRKWPGEASVLYVTVHLRRV
jgi:hypothetical protein